MNTIRIETLSPVHIGSGNLLNNNTDFISVTIKKGDISKPYLVIVSEEKVWKLLGEQHVDNWLQAIANRENLRDFLKRFAPEAKSKDYTKRRMPLLCEINRDDTLKECIHNGTGLPYIPGSSIKGAIRTAILALLANTISDREHKIFARDNKGNYVKDRKGNQLFEATAIEKELFGDDPNSDVFRFIQVGDAYFEKETEIAIRLVSLNIRQRLDSLWDESKPQIVEAIKTKSESKFQLKLSKEYYGFVKRNFPQAGSLPVSSIGELFSLINDHTRQLVEEEINYWNEVDKTDGDDYVEEMKKILQEINLCEAGKSCVLRIGHASGWRFMTGAWTESLSNFKDVVVPASRPENRYYEQYDFPKTRRLDEESYILGFVKLTK